jgi:hypothetical protein
VTRRSTCTRCGRPVEGWWSELYRAFRWRHVELTTDGHTPEPAGPRGE